MEAEGPRSASASTGLQLISRALYDELARRHAANGLQLRQGNTKNVPNSMSPRFLTAPRALA